VLRCSALRSAYGALFPGIRFCCKNSVGIYTPDEVFMCKRGVCFSLEKLVLTNFLSEIALGTVTAKSLVWGICGIVPTRANEAVDRTFLLCYQDGKRFIAQALVNTDEMLDGSITIKASEDRNAVTDTLKAMQRETVEYSRRKQENKQARKRSRGEAGGKTHSSDSKKVHVDSSAMSSCNTNSVQENSTCPTDQQPEEVADHQDDVTQEGGDRAELLSSFGVGQTEEVRTLDGNEEICTLDDGDFLDLALPMGNDMCDTSSIATLEEEHSDPEQADMSKLFRSDSVDDFTKEALRNPWDTLLPVREDMFNPPRVFLEPEGSCFQEQANFFYY